jgi:putative transposase
VRSFKSAVSKAVGRSIWQRNYYEHVIRNEDELNRIRDYIDDNPIMWSVDTENPAHASIGAKIPTTTRVWPLD